MTALHVFGIIFIIGHVLINVVAGQGPCTIIGFSSTNVTNTSIGVKWDTNASSLAACAGALSANFSLCYPANQSTPTPSTCVSTNNSFYTILSLEPFTTYNITLTADVTPSNVTVAATTIQVATAEDAPCSPMNLVTTANTSSSITFSWQQPQCQNGVILGYFLCYQANVSIPRTCTDTKLMTLTVNSLSSYTNYSVSIFAYNTAGNGSLVAIQARTAEASPCAPTGLVSTANTSYSIAFSWQQPSCPNGVIQGYFLCYQANGTGTQVCILTNTTTTNVTSLSPYTSYNVTVFAFTSAGNGTVSISVLARTAEAPPCAPTGLVMTATTSNSLVFSWQQPSCPNGMIIGYFLCYSSNGTRLCTATGTTTANVTSLLPYTSFNVTVFGYTLAGNGSESAYVLARTAEARPCAPVGLTTTFNTSSSITFSWNTPLCPNGVILGYVLCYQAIQNSTRACIGSGNTTVTATGLSAYTAYNVTVLGYTTAGNGSESIYILARTAEATPCPPAELSNSSVANNSISFSWKSPPCPNGMVLGYYLCYQAADNIATTCISSGNSTSLTVGSLLAYTTYNVTVFAYTVAGNGSQSSALITQTAEYLPCAPTELASTSSTNSITLTWTSIAKSCANGIVRGYYVCYQSAGSATLCTKVVNSSADIGSLAAYTNYTMTVFGYTSAGNGSSSSVVAATGIAKPACAPPISGTAPTNSSVNVTWAIPDRSCANGEVVATEVCYNAVGPPLVTSSQSAVTATCVNVSGPIIQGLQAYQQYNLTIRIYTSAGPGPSGPPQVFQTKSSSPTDVPTNIAASDVQAYSLTITWQPIAPLSRNGDIISYRISYTSDSSPGPEISVLGNNTSQTLGSLWRSTTYAVKIKGCTDAGCGAYSPSLQVSTTIDVSLAAGLSVGLILLVLIAIIIAVIVLHRRGKWPFTKATGGSGGNMTSMRFATTKHRPMKLIDLPGRVTGMHADSNLRFHEEYEELKDMSPKHSTDAAAMQGNTAKNRYVDILPFDHTRVKLLPLADEEGSDYINANYMPGHQSRREFIAAQGPLPGTVDHFWRMIWEQNVSVVVMLTQLLEKGKRKCDQYWPETINESLTYGDLIVTKTAESSASDYCVRTLKVSLNEYSRQVTLLAYMSWPDFGCPQTTDALLNFVAVFRSYMASGPKGPAIVHCSAGVGRTGTFICLDRMLQQIKSKDEVDIFGTVLEMRDFRTRMVQTEDQYVYIHDCIKDALLRGHSPFYRVEKTSVYAGEDTSQYINFDPKPRPNSKGFRNSSRASSSEGLVTD